MLPRTKLLIFGSSFFVMMFMAVGLSSTKASAMSYKDIPASVAPESVRKDVASECNPPLNFTSVEVEWVSEAGHPSVTDFEADYNKAVHLQENFMTYRCRVDLTWTSTEGSILTTKAQAYTASAPGTKYNLGSITGKIKNMAFVGEKSTGYKVSPAVKFNGPALTRDDTLYVKTWNRGTLAKHSNTYTYKGSSRFYICAQTGSDTTLVYTNGLHDFTPKLPYCRITTGTTAVRVHVTPNGTLSLSCKNSGQATISMPSSQVQRVGYVRVVDSAGTVHSYYSQRHKVPYTFDISEYSSLQKVKVQMYLYDHFTGSYTHITRQDKSIGPCGQEVVPNPPAGDCGGNIGIVLDTSNSVAQNNLNNPELIKSGIDDFMNQLGPGRQMALWTFGTLSTGSGSQTVMLGNPPNVPKPYYINRSHYPGIGFTTLNKAGKKKIDTAYRNIIYGTSGQYGWTNWGAGLGESVAPNGDKPSDSSTVFIITDGDPTVPGGPGHIGDPDSGFGSYTYAGLEAGTEAANAIKSHGVRVVAIGVGQADPDHLKLISGPTENSDYYMSDGDTYSDIAELLEKAYSKNCGNQPYFQVNGGDLQVGNAFATNPEDPNSCTQASSASVVGWTTGPGGDYTGAGTEYAAYALGVIDYFASEQKAGSGPPSSLSFSNTYTTAQSGVDGTYGGNLGNYSSCVPDYYDAKPASTSSFGGGNISSLGSGSYSSSGNVTISGGNVNPGERIVLYVNGNVQINGQIRYVGNMSADKPSYFEMVATGNIYISPGVRRLDGVYIAQGRGGRGGTLYTCASGFSPVDLSSDLYNTCNSQLTINGAVVAQDVELMRAYGSVGKPNDAAETINYNPSVWIAGSQLDSSNPSYDYDSITSLPPVL